MSDDNRVEVDFYTKRYSDFDLIRIARAVGQKYEDDVTAFLVNVQIYKTTAVGAVFGHVRQGPHGRFSDGHLIKTSDILGVKKEGRFWVITTVHSRYVVATFRRDGGRRSLRDFRLQVGNRYPNT